MPAPVAPTIAPTVPPAIPDAERAAFEARLRALQARYHIHHPFNQRMASGQCSRAQIEGWVPNLFYSQVNIPLKDPAILSNCPDRATRREWVVRILDHDGSAAEPGGIEAWSRLGEGVGVTGGALWFQRIGVSGAGFGVGVYVKFGGGV